jgi:hypothetical protein
MWSIVAYRTCIRQCPEGKATDGYLKKADLRN